MPTIPYIDDGDEVTAGHQNDLWAEFDRKMTICMDGKSWLLFQDANGPTYINTIVGPKFFFTDLTTFGRSIDIAGAGGPNYDHSVFTSAVTAATVLGTPDYADKIVTLTGFGSVDLQYSLEAHKKSTTNEDGDLEDYWVWQDGAIMPQRLHRYAAAELVFEHSGVTSYTIPNTYNKYQYFRCHNLNPVEITVTFTALDGLTDFTLTIPAYGCKTCQRRPLGQMEAGYNYFWKFLPGDPRSLTTKPFGGNIAAESMRINNVWNPALVYEIVELFSERYAIGLSDGRTGLTPGASADPVNPVRMIRDPHIIYEISDLYSDYLADPATDTNLLGDILHHKGEIHYNYRDTAGALQKVVGDFTGYGSLSDLAAMGFTVVSGGGGVTIQGTLGSEFNDVVAPGTNLLFHSGGEVVTAAEISTARSIEHSQPVMNDDNPFYCEMYVPVNITSDTETVEYRAFSIDSDLNVSFGGATSVTFTRNLIDKFPTDETATLKPHADTIATGLLFNTFGLVALNSTDQDIDVRTLQNRRIVQTIFGPIILWEEKWNFSASAKGGPMFSLLRSQMTPGRPFARLDGDGKLVEHHYAVWGGYGWPAYPHRDNSTNPSPGYNGADGAFLGPRVTRSSNDLGVAGKHINYGQPIYGPDGQDFTIIPLDRVESEIRLLFTPSYASPAGGHMPVWGAPDLLMIYEAAILTGVDSDYVDIRSDMQAETPTTSWMPRVKMLREHYNTMASWVNSCIKCRPFCWTDFVHYLPSTTESGIGAALLELVSDNGNIPSFTGPTYGTRGLMGTSVRPSNQYASFEDGSFLHHLFTALSVPIKTWSDLPSAFLTATTTDSTMKYFHGSYDIVIDTVTNIGTDLWQYKMHDEIHTLTLSDVVFGTGPLDCPFRKIGGHNASYVFDASPPSGGWPVNSDPTLADDFDTTYLWVTISDVKSAAESMGLKWIFEEVSLPLKLHEYSVGGSYSTVISSLPYFYRTDGTDTPQSTGVYQNRTFGETGFDDFTPPQYDYTRLKFIPSTSSVQWKRDLQYSDIVADIKAADIYAFSLGGVGSFVVKFTDADDELTASEYDFRQPPSAGFFYRQAQMYQISASSDYTIESGAFLIPVPWYTYPTNDWTDQSDDKARARWGLPDGNVLYPVEVAGGYAASEDPVFFSSGSNMIDPLSDRAVEVLIWKDTYVSLA